MLVAVVADAAVVAVDRLVKRLVSLRGGLVGGVVFVVAIVAVIVDGGGACCAWWLLMAAAAVVNSCGCFLLQMFALAVINFSAVVAAFLHQISSAYPTAVVNGCCCCCCCCYCCCCCC